MSITRMGHQGSISIFEPERARLNPTVSARHKIKLYAINRQVPVHPVLKEILLTYKPESSSLWLFPARLGDKPITLRWADAILRAAVDKAGLSAKGISTHSTRRSFITNLANKGINLAMNRPLAKVPVRVKWGLVKGDR